MVAEVAMAMAEAASTVVVVAVVTMPARSSRRWSRLGRRQLPPRATLVFGSASPGLSFRHATPFLGCFIKSSVQPSFIRSTV